MKNEKRPETGGFRLEDKTENSQKTACGFALTTVY
jgi:hypothetical protein